VKNLEQVREEIRVVQDHLINKIDGELTTIHRELEKRKMETDEYSRFTQSNLDRRFDNVWEDIHKLKVT